MEFICKFCSSQRKSNKSLIAHEATCPENPNGYRNKPWNKGKSKNDDERLAKASENATGKKRGPISEETRKKLRIACGGKQMSPEFKEKRRLEMLARYERGWVSTAGRCKKYSYESEIAGEVKVDGTWELKVCKYLDSMGYVWKRNTDRFPYINLEGKLSHYTPDFWIEDLGTYLEIKGYETELDRCKWRQFHEPLLIWRKNEIKGLEG